MAVSRSAGERSVRALLLSRVESGLIIVPELDIRVRVSCEHIRCHVDSTLRQFRLILNNVISDTGNNRFNAVHLAVLS